MTTETRLAEDQLPALGRRLAELFPAATQHRGWTVANLTHNYEQTPFGVEETWSCDLIGPRDLWTDRRRWVGGSAFTWQLGTGAIGTAEATTADGLVEQVAAIVDTFGIRALTEPLIPSLADPTDHYEENPA